MRDWFTVESLDYATIVIREKRYWQGNNQYLLLGRDRALLFDSGSGKRDITPVIQGLTSLPVIVMGSHLHYDHIGGHRRLGELPEVDIAVPDLPATRAMASSGILHPPWSARLVPKPRPFAVHQWWALGQNIDLGDRIVQLVALPGHTADSVGMLDRQHGFAYVGDFLYQAPILAALPTASVVDYLNSALRLQIQLNGERMLSGHYVPRISDAKLGELIYLCDRALTSPTSLTGHHFASPLTVTRHRSTTLIAGRRALQDPGG